MLGVRVLRNECAPAREVRVVGVEEIWTDLDDLRGALEQCAGWDSRTIVLGHNPDLLLRIEAQHPALDPARTLFLFGHTHQGQIYIPFLPGLAVPIESKFYRGIYRTPFGVAYVSAGCGENTTPTRLNTRPEIVVIDL
jgi:predicted MPP superfamily phosphohydrolase